MANTEIWNVYIFLEYSRVLKRFFFYSGTQTLLKINFGIVFQDHYFQIRPRFKNVCIQQKKTNFLLDILELEVLNICK